MFIREQWLKNNLKIVVDEFGENFSSERTHPTYIKSTNTIDKKKVAREKPNKEFIEMYKSKYNGIKLSDV